MTGNRLGRRWYKNDRDYDRGFVGVSMRNLIQKASFYHYYGEDRNGLQLENLSRFRASSNNRY